MLLGKPAAKNYTYSYKTIPFIVFNHKAPLTYNLKFEFVFVFMHVKVINTNDVKVCVRALNYSQIKKTFRRVIFTSYNNIRLPSSLSAACGS